MSEETVTAAPRPLRLRTNFSSMFVGNVIVAALQWGELVILAKVMPEEQVGLFVLGQAVSTPFVVFGSMRMRPVQVANTDFRFADFLGFRLVAMALTVMAIAAFAYAKYAPIAAGVIVLVGVHKASGLISDVMYGELQRHHRMDRLALLRVLHQTVGVVAMGVVIVLTRDLMWTIAAMAVSSVVALFAFECRTVAWVWGGKWKGMLPVFEYRQMKKLAWLILPLGLSATIASLNVNLPRYFVEGVLGTAALGIFGLLSYVFFGLNRAVESLTSAALPRLAQFSNEGRYEAFKGLQIKLLLIGGLTAAGFLLGLLFFGKPLLRIIYSEKYAAEFGVFMWVSLAGALLLLTNMVRSGLFAVRCYRFQVVWDVFLMGVLLVACLVLIPNHGLMGAAWTVVIGQATQLATGLAMLAWAAQGIRSRRPPMEEESAGV